MSTLKVDKLYAGDRSTDSDENVLLNDDGTTNVKGNTTIAGTCTATTFSGSGASLTNIPAANLTGTLPAISGASLTNLPASGINRNLLANGAMQVAQRSVGPRDFGGGKMTVDRFHSNAGWTDELPQGSQHALTSSDTGPWEKGFRYSLHGQNGNQTGGEAANRYVSFVYDVEASVMATSGWDYTDSSSKVVLSFWVKSSVAQTFYGNLKTTSGTVKSFPFSTGSLSANTWTKVTKVIPGHADLTFANDATNGFEMYWWMYAGSNKTDASVSLDAWMTNDEAKQTPVSTATWFTTNDSTFELTGVKLEVADAATEYDHKNFTEDLWECRRYCQAFKGDSSDFLFGPGYEGGGGSFYMPVMLNPPMRGSPSMQIHSGSWKEVGDGGSSATAYTGAMTAYDPQPGPIFTSVLFWKDTDYPNGDDGNTVWMRSDATGTVMSFEAEI